MNRYLNGSQISSALNRGKSVEQLLDSYISDGVSWLELRPSDDGVELWHFQVIDEGQEDYLDVYSFSPVQEEGPFVPKSIHADLSIAMKVAELEFRADPLRWVNQFILQDEYRDRVFLKHHK